MRLLMHTMLLLVYLLNDVFILKMAIFLDWKE